MYIDKNIQINERFADISEKTYHAETESLDTNNTSNSVKIINDWVAEKTHGHIKDLVDEEAVSNSVILMINAIYFQGAWRKGFMKNETITDVFNVSKDKTEKVEFMKQKAKFVYGSSKFLDSKMLRLPYKGNRYAMFFILPNKVDGIGALCSKLNASTLKNEISLMSADDVYVTIPKFKFDSTIHLNDALKELGIRQIFTNHAQLDLLSVNSSTPIKVSNIIQKAGLIVDEVGTTAYAATGNN